MRPNPGKLNTTSTTNVPVSNHAAVTAITLIGAGNAAGKMWRRTTIRSAIPRARAASTNGRSSVTKKLARIDLIT